MTRLQRHPSPGDTHPSRAIFLPGLLPVHLAVILFGLAGLFGKLLPHPPLVIVLGRTALAAAGLLPVLLWTGRGLRLPTRRHLAALASLGVLLALHWVCFFQSIQVSTVAIGLLTYSTFPLFVTFLEPLLFHEKLRRADVATALLVFLGLVLVVPSFRISHHVFQGVLWGTFSGLTFAVLSLLNRKLVRTCHPLVITFYQNGTAALVLLPGLLLLAPRFSGRDLALLALLGLFCTALSHALFIQGLRHVTTQLASLAAALEPVYGIVFALVLLREVPAGRTLLGGAVILAANILAVRLHPRPAVSPPG
ncbi:MAG: DMT family transporter [Acidobacteria bacterium]|nr:DMT family transporter [Acidobacteriota bacterium]